MDKRILWTTTALLTTALGTPLTSHADEINPPEVNPKTTSPHTLQKAQPTEVVKVGEYQSPAVIKASDTVIAKIKPHEVAGRQAATLYIRDIPVLTFLSSSPIATSGIKVGATEDARGATGSAQTKVATTGMLDLSKQANAETDVPSTTDPVWRATAVAARINQLRLDSVDASNITAVWKAGGAPISSKDGEGNKTNSDRYLIKINGEELVEINAETRLPDTTNDLAKDALQATNRLRRLLGNAPPLLEIYGKPVALPKLPQALPLPKLPQALPLPKLPKEISLGPLRIKLNGWASWYGPGFNGNKSASGERYNQNALTAAHRSLPFGTKVKVTNIRTGLSVVVRINDRGPYIRGRILDLSAAAARLLGLMQTGVAPVRVEVLSNQTSTPAK